MQIAGYQCQIYDISVAGRPLRIAGPAAPDALLDDPEVAMRFERDEYMPYWAMPWPASVMLAEYLLSGEADWPRSRGAVEAGVFLEVLEIGAGLGIVSVALAAAGWRVVATEYDDDALAFIEANARLNGVSVEARRLDWREAPAAKFDCIMAADVLYEDRHHEAVAAFLAAGLTEGGVAFVADPCRAKADSFPLIASVHGLRCTAISRRCRTICEAISRDFNGRVFLCG